MKNKLPNSVLIFTLTFLVFIFFYACQKLDLNRITKSKIAAISAFDANTINLEVDIFDLSPTKHPDYGICYSATNSVPTIGDSKFSIGAIKDCLKFKKSIENLKPSTKYYFRAYVMNDENPQYSFNTQEATTPILPDMATITASNLTSTSATLNASVNPNNNTTSLAFEYGLTSNLGQLAIPIPEFISGGSIKTFSAIISGLTPNTIYHFRAKGIIGKTIIYGSELTFTTPQTALPTVVTSVVGNIAQNTAIGGGIVTSEGDAAVIARGVCWSTSPNPTIANSVTNDGNGIGNFSSSITGLNLNTTYYVRAYATNSTGTGYGSQVVFTTSTTITLPSVTTAIVGNITQNSATCGGNVTSDGGDAVTSRGVCWSTSQNPTIANSKTNDGNGIGNFSSNITSLNSFTTYYINAYATNSVGTAYGTEISFTTSSNIISNPGSGVTFNGYTYKSILLGNGQEWMAENLRTAKYANGIPIPNITSDIQWPNLTTGAFAYYNNNNQYENPYGKLYNWYAVVDSRNICPTGWHVPNDAEWSMLINYLDPYVNSPIAGGKMKSIGTQYWQSPNTGATNESGFSGLPGGYRWTNGNFMNLGTEGNWWSTSQVIGMNYSNYMVLNYNTSKISQNGYYRVLGLSVRCLKN